MFNARLNVLWPVSRSCMPCTLILIYMQKNIIKTRLEKQESLNPLLVPVPHALCPMPRSCDKYSIKNECNPQLNIPSRFFILIHTKLFFPATFSFIHFSPPVPIFDYLFIPYPYICIHIRMYLHLNSIVSFTVIFNCISLHIHPYQYYF